MRLSENDGAVRKRLVEGPQTPARETGKIVVIDRAPK
jgi:hypothetical protein